MVQIVDGSRKDEDGMDDTTDAQVWEQGSAAYLGLHIEGLSSTLAADGVPFAWEV
jgi:hypothetical protein